MKTILSSEDLETLSAALELRLQNQQQLLSECLRLLQQFSARMVEIEREVLEMKTNAASQPSARQVASLTEEVRSTRAESHTIRKHLQALSHILSR